MEEKTQLSYYVCQTPSCPRIGIPMQIRENQQTGKPLNPNATKCDSADGCGQRWVLIPMTTEPE